MDFFFVFFPLFFLFLQHESLKKVEQEQKATIERLGNNEA
jgi:hypothetical protein